MSTGGFDERYFLYYEDVDLARRGAELGVALPDRVELGRASCRRRLHSVAERHPVRRTGTDRGQRSGSPSPPPSRGRSGRRFGGSGTPYGAMLALRQASPRWRRCVWSSESLHRLSRWSADRSRDRTSGELSRASFQCLQASSSAPAPGRGLGQSFDIASQLTQLRFERARSARRSGKPVPAASSASGTSGAERTASTTNW